MEYYEARRIEHPENFYVRNKAIIWVYSGSSAIIGLGIIPWVIGWITILS